MKKKSIASLALLLLMVSQLFAQDIRVIDTTDYEKRKALKEYFEKQHEQQYKGFKKEFPRKVRNQITATYKSIHGEFLKNLKKRRFIFDDRYTSYVDSLTQKIIEKNPTLQGKKFHFFISRNPTVNAFNAGDGIIVLNIGLFRFFENEAQLASIITHEMGHDELEHVRNSIVEFAQFTSSKESTLRAKRIRKMRYNQYDQAFKIMKRFAYDTGKERRRKEMEADTHGFKLYENMDLPLKEYTNAFRAFQRYDSLPEIELDTMIYEQFFDLPDQSFQKKWLLKEDFSNYDYSKFTEKINQDSVLTHPDIDKRIEKLELEFPQIVNEVKTERNYNPTYDSLRKIAKKEAVVNLYDLEKYGLSMYHILHRLSREPDNAFYKHWLGENFLAIHKAKKKYQMNRHVDILQPKDQNPYYQLFLSFLWNLRLQELEMIGNYYANPTN